MFSKRIIKEILKDTLGGTHIILEEMHLDRPELVATGYCYNSKVTLSFIITKNAGSTRKGSPYKMKFIDSYGNVNICLAYYSLVISEFLKY